MLTAFVALAAVQTSYTPASGAPDVEGGPLRFEVAMPAVVDRLPALSAALRARMARARAQAAAFARSQDLAARRGHYPFNQHGYEATWTVEGRTARLISLSAVVETYTGGGHGEHGYDLFLWDVAARRPVAMRALFGPAAIAALGRRFCPAYVEARGAHLGDAPPENPEPGGEWTCPRFATAAAGPADRDGNGRFDSYRVFISTGNFDVEGYSVDLSLGAADVARIPAAYRASFEVGR